MDQAAERETIIEPPREDAAGRLRELFRYGAFYRFMFREIMMRRWRNTLLGFWWLIIRPLIPAVMAVITFTFIVPMPSYGLPYPIFHLAGFMAWNLFYAALMFLPRSLMMMRALMKRTYFPRLLVPLAAIGPALVELTVTATLFVAALLVFGVQRGELFVRTDAWLLLVPVCLLASLALAVALGMVGAVFALFVRDVIFVIPYFGSIMMFLTPVIYPITVVPERFRWLVYLFNPMAKIVETTRWALTGEGVFEFGWFLLSLAEIGGILAVCVWFFLRVETVMADTL